MNVLVVAYYYPPLESGGTQRPSMMAKYLPRFGHRVTVLSHTYGRSDVLEGGVLRVRDVSHNLHRKGFGGLCWLGLRISGEAANLLGRYDSIYSSWRRRVLSLSDAIIAAANPDAVLATYPPVEDFEIGLDLSERYGLPLVGDFRDGLLFEAIERRRMDRHRCVADHYSRVEAAVAERSASLVTAFPALSDYLDETYGRPDVVTIPNGFDPEDYEGLGMSDLLETKHFNIVHTGRFGGSYSGMDVRPLCTAIRSLLAEDPDLAHRVRLHLVGSIEDHERRSCADLIRRGVVVEHGNQPRPVALAAQAEADALLLLTTRDRPGNAPGKLFEYLRAGRPILALTSHSYAGEIVLQTATGSCADPDDPAAIAGLLRDVVTSGRRAGEMRPDEEQINRFSRSEQMRQLADVLEVARSPKKPPLNTSP